MISSSNSFLSFSRIFLGGCGGGGVWDLFGAPLFIRLEEGRMISGCVSFPTMLLEAERKGATFRFNQGNGSCNLVWSKLDRTSLKPGRFVGRAQRFEKSNSIYTPYISLYTPLKRWG